MSQRPSDRSTEVAIAAADKILENSTLGQTERFKELEHLLYHNETQSLVTD
jgi:hypothetical protein